MTGTLIAIVAIIWLLVVDTVRMGETYPLPQVLPFCSGRPAGGWDFAGCAVLAAFFLLLWRSCRRRSGAAGAGRPANGANVTRPTFRHSLWLIPLTVACAHYIRRNVKPSIHWGTLLAHVPDPVGFSQLIILTATCAAVLVSVSIWQKR